MSQTYNVYCDESCHLENDHQKAMVLGAIWLPKEKVREVSTRIREIKEKHDLNRHFEIKWTKVSPAKINFYFFIIDYFFDDDDLHFRCLVVPDKSILEHDKHDQTHDEWYYKMYFTLLKVVFKPSDHYRIYIDIKDTLGGEKVSKLEDVLCSHMYDFDHKIIERVQLIHSHESEVMQIADLLIGAMSHLHRDQEESSAKQQLISRMKERSKYSLKRDTLLKEDKFNILIWRPNE
ncbi:MAG: DUF3800 domain-containing protein [Candidatus Peregrinibacteria bacterium]|nr:DUF3800 domain-containing protein [Candidatus Peregrinibacteria bacterium]